MKKVAACRPEIGVSGLGHGTLKPVLYLFIILGMAGLIFTATASAETLLWNGPGDPATTAELREDPLDPGYMSLFGDDPTHNSLIVNADGPYSVYGGMVYFAEIDNDTVAVRVDNNSVTLNGGSVINLAGAYTSYGDAYDNHVLVNGGYAEIVKGGVSNRGRASFNTVTMQGGEAEELYGGYANSHVQANKVFINGGAAGLVAGGSSTAGGRAYENEVFIQNATVGSVYGGRSLSGRTDNNTIHILNSIVEGEEIAGSYSARGNAVDNTVTLEGDMVFTSSTRIMGGFAGTTGDSFTGNTLNLWNYTSDAMLQSIENFEFYTFILPSSLQSGDTLLTAEEIYLDDRLSPTGTGAGSTVTSLDMLRGSGLTTGDTITLMNGTLYGTLENIHGNVEGRKGIFLLYDFWLNQTDTALTATVTNISLNPQAKALPEGQLASLSFINQGGNLIAGPGMMAAINAAENRENSGITLFTAFDGTSYRYDTGSYVDVSGFSLMAGLAWDTRKENRKFLLGAFFERGWGSYNSYNSFHEYKSVRAKGDTDYYGGGLLGRLDWMGSGNLYTEASLRLGRAETDFSSSDLMDVEGQRATYDTGTEYYGAHLGAGYIYLT